VLCRSDETEDERTLSGSVTGGGGVDRFFRNARPALCNVPARRQFLHADSYSSAALRSPTHPSSCTTTAGIVDDAIRERLHLCETPLFAN